ncbi:unnamed protein product [Didymodactylos carnosus]|uniref:FLYWCH-type domain-containing protein n=1 Tax=Didymodactylos carnosus TaxID=1234261 RepID=A0A815JFK0_9BILA|nr:unnamed protein product [Didymodactylos carnosus]CAF4276907.1 unnamed protein product [Didymodactylos carnosus]
MYFTNKKTGEQYPLGGFRPSSEPSTAKKFSSSRKFGSAEIPKKVDLREMMTPVKRQGTLQSCKNTSTAISTSVSCTTKQKPRLELQGFSYIKDRFTENKTYWRCIYYNSQKCHARFHTCNITNNVITPPSDHTCKSNGITGELRKFNEDLWYRTMNTQETPDLIITHCCIGMSDEALARLPSRDNIKRRIRMLPLTVTSRGDKFLRCDTGRGPDRMLIFASSEQLDILQSCDDFLVDGTFKVVPEIFYQLYVVHAIYRGHVVPVVYSLLSRKNSDTYQRLINEIAEFAPCWFPASILLDFEKACACEFSIKKNSSKHVDVSRLFIYYNARVKEGNWYEDDGTTIVAAHGRPEPSKQAYEEAMRYRVSEKLSVDTDLGIMKACLARGLPFVFGIQLFESFGQAEDLETKGTVPLPGENEKGRSNGDDWHAMLAGDKGYCYIPYDYMANPKRCLEAHAVQCVMEDGPNALWYPITDSAWKDTSSTTVLSPKHSEHVGWSSDDTTDIYGWDKNKNKADSNYAIEAKKTEETEKQPQTSNGPHILWVDSESKDPLCRHLKAESGVTIAFCETYAMAEEYLSKNIQYIKNCRPFQIICRGYYQSENRNPLNILDLINNNEISYSTSIVVYTRDKSGVERWLAQSPTQAWRQRLFITDDGEQAFNYIKKGWKSGTS